MGTNHEVSCSTLGNVTIALACRTPKVTEVSDGFTAGNCKDLQQERVGRH